MISNLEYLNQVLLLKEINHIGIKCQLLQIQFINSNLIKNSDQSLILEGLTTHNYYKRHNKIHKHNTMITMNEASMEESIEFGVFHCSYCVCLAPR